MHDDIKKALEVLRSGGIILYPTDTIWGLGCDATNEEAVQKIYTIKKRTDSKSMIILIDSENRLSSYVEEVPEVAYNIMELSEKPVTVIFEGAKYLAANVINQEDNSIGIRITHEAFSKQLIQQFKKPIVSTSANISGDHFPASFKDINQEILKQVDYVVQYRQGDHTASLPSSIIKIGKDATVKIIRK